MSWRSTSSSSHQLPEETRRGVRRRLRPAALHRLAGMLRLGCVEDAPTSPMEPKGRVLADHGPVVSVRSSKATCAQGWPVTAGGASLSCESSLRRAKEVRHGEPDDRTDGEAPRARPGAGSKRRCDEASEP